MCSICARRSVLTDSPVVDVVLGGGGGGRIAHHGDLQRGQTTHTQEETMRHTVHTKREKGQGEHANRGRRREHLDACVNSMCCFCRHLDEDVSWGIWTERLWWWHTHNLRSAVVRADTDRLVNMVEANLIPTLFPGLTPLTSPPTTHFIFTEALSSPRCSNWSPNANAPTRRPSIGPKLPGALSPLLIKILQY